MSYQERVDELAGMVAALPTAGQVHNRTRLAKHWGEYIARFKDDGVINGWEITRVSARPEINEWVEVFRLRKFRGLNDADATDLVFQEDLDSAVRLFRDTPNLSFGVITAGLEILEAEERVFGDVLCHYAECELTVQGHYETL